VTIGIAILPFSAENRDARAQAGLDRLRREADSVIVVDNNSLARFDELTLREAFGLVNRMVQTVVQGVLDHLQRSYLTTVTEEVETVAREIEGETPTPLPVHVEAPPAPVQAAWETQPVSFDENGFIGFR
jgi:cell division GTPase FtsZ